MNKGKKNQSPSQINENDNKKVIIEILERIRKWNKNNEESPTEGYSIDKEVIKNLFNITDGKNIQDIKARLALIDNLYSTQLSRRFFGLDMLSQALYDFQKKNDIVKMFSDFAKKFSAFADAPNTEDLDVLTLWTTKYGIDKYRPDDNREENDREGNDGDGEGNDDKREENDGEGEGKAAAVSLISKYVYFASGFKFPIYDSIVCGALNETGVLGQGMLRTLLAFLSGRNYNHSLRKNGNNVQWNEIIVRFLKALNSLKKELNLREEWKSNEELKLGEEESEYDLLDQLMWFTGKMLRGNFGGILSRDEYKNLKNEVLDRNINTATGQKDRDNKWRAAVFKIQDFESLLAGTNYRKNALVAIYEFAQQLHNDPSLAGVRVRQGTSV